jgi:hypothetical protein
VRSLWVPACRNYSFAWCQHRGAYTWVQSILVLGSDMPRCLCRSRLRAFSKPGGCAPRRFCHGFCWDPLVFLVVALLHGLDVFGCMRRWTIFPHMARVSCGLITGVLLVPLLGALSGLMVLRAWHHLKSRGGVAV